MSLDAALRKQHILIIINLKFIVHSIPSGACMFYIGVSHYFATGEGCVIYVASGSKASIQQSIPDYFHQGLVMLTPAEWLQAASEHDSDEAHRAAAEIIKRYLPVLWQQIEQNAPKMVCNLEFFMRHYVNYA